MILWIIVTVMSLWLFWICLGKSKCVLKTSRSFYPVFITILAVLWTAVVTSFPIVSHYSAILVIVSTLVIVMIWHFYLIFTYRQKKGLSISELLLKLTYMLLLHVCVYIPVWIICIIIVNSNL